MSILSFVLHGVHKCYSYLSRQSFTFAKWHQASGVGRQVFKARRFRSRLPIALRPVSYAAYAMLFALCAMPLSAANAATVTLAWDKSPESDIAGYKIHYGTAGGSYQYSVNVGNCTSCTISGLAEGTTYYFAATAYNAGNTESSFSPEVAYTIPVPDTDGDQDGISDNDETSIYGTDNNKADTDNDGIGDGEELLFWGTQWNADYDKDGLMNVLDQDSDGDGYPDGQEMDNGSIPSDPFDDGVIDDGNLSYVEDFESYAVGKNPVDWMDTGSSSSMTEKDSLFKVYDVRGKVFGTVSTSPNIHSHYTAVSYDASIGFVYSGRMRMSSSKSGIGITFLSQYPVSDTYYRLHRHGSNSLHISPHGTTVAGDINSGVTPKANTWYWFKIQVLDTGSRTEIKAKIWADGKAEPSGWQIDAWDTSATRLSNGTIGVWSSSSGKKYWDDLAVGAISSSR